MASETKTTPATEQRCSCGRAIERPDLHNACHRCVVGPEDPRDKSPKTYTDLTDKQRAALGPARCERCRWLSRKRYMEPRAFSATESMELRELLAKAQFLGEVAGSGQALEAEVAAMNDARARVAHPSDLCRCGHAPHRGQCAGTRPDGVYEGCWCDSFSS